MKCDDVRLRALEPEDLDLLCALENDQTLWIHGNTTTPYSRHALSLYIATCSNDIFQDRQLRLVVEAQGRAVGLVDLFSLDIKHSRAEVGIAICPGDQQKGHGRAALESLLQYIMQHLPLHQVYAYVSVENIAAEKAFRKAGFQQQGVLTDWIAIPHQGYADAILFQYLFQH